MPHPESLKLDIIEVENSSPGEWSVVAPIYTSEEGFSDLSIELWLIENGTELYKSELDNISGVVEYNFTIRNVTSTRLNPGTDLGPA